MSASLEEDTEIFSLQEVADRTGKGIATVYRYLRRGKLLTEKFAGEWVVNRTDLQEWLPSALFRKHFGPIEEV